MDILRLYYITKGAEPISLATNIVDRIDVYRLASKWQKQPKLVKIKDTNKEIVPVNGVITVLDIRVSISIEVIIPFSG
ncbi:MAG TPA: hypothetical protein VJL58_10800 [Pyrinomonadaceae bacterium]|nr:hypothetical protein [Pyrinomonadaceae bacterium]